MQIHILDGSCQRTGLNVFLTSATTNARSLLHTHTLRHTDTDTHTDPHTGSRSLAGNSMQGDNGVVRPICSLGKPLSSACRGCVGFDTQQICSVIHIACGDQIPFHISAWDTEETPLPYHMAEMSFCNQQTQNKKGFSRTVSR